MPLPSSNGLATLQEILANISKAHLSFASRSLRKVSLAFDCRTQRRGKGPIGVVLSDDQRSVCFQGAQRVISADDRGELLG